MHNPLYHFEFFSYQGYLKVDITVLGKGDPAKVSWANLVRLILCIKKVNDNVLQGYVEDLNLFSMDGTARSTRLWTADIALGIMETCKPPHHNKVVTPFQMKWMTLLCGCYLLLLGAMGLSKQVLTRVSN